MIYAIFGLYNPIVYRKFIGIELSALLLGVTGDKIADSFGINAIDSLGDHTPIAFHNTNHWGLSFGTAPLIAGSFLVGGLVLFFASDIGFINLHLPGEKRLILAINFADSVIQKPGRLLGNTDHFGKLNRGDTLLRGGEKVDSEKPLVKRELGLSEDRPRSDGEFQAAIMALIGLVIRERIDVLTSAIRAVNAVCKASGGKIFNASILRGELLVKLLY